MSAMTLLIHVWCWSPRIKSGSVRSITLTSDVVIKIPPAKPDLTNPIPDLYPQPNQPQGWGLTFMLTLSPGATGRGRNTAWWAGLPNLFWWCDRTMGIAGMIASQILPFAGLSTSRSHLNDAAVLTGNRSECHGALVQDGEDHLRPCGRDGCWERKRCAVTAS